MAKQEPNMKIDRARQVLSALTLALASAGAAWGQFPQLPVLPQFPPGVKLPFPGMPQAGGQRATALAGHAELRQDWAGALPHYEQSMRDAVSQPEPLRSEALRNLLPNLASVLMKLGRLDDAELALHNLAALPQAPGQGQGQDGGFAEVMRTLQGAFRLAEEGLRGVNQRLYAEGDGSEAVDAALAFRIPATTVISVLWAELRARQGRHDEVRRLWHQDFQAYRNSAIPKGADLDAAVAADEVAVAAWRMALALQAGDAHGEALDAMTLALSLNRQRLQTLAAVQPMVEAQFGGFQQRRWMATTTLQLALRSGSQQHQRLALGAIASAKGLTNRFQQRRRTLLGTLDGMGADSHRARIRALEAQQPQLASDGAAGVKAWVDWTNQYVAQVQPLMPALAKAGLSKVFADGDELLDQIQRRLQPDEAIIGYLQFQALDLGAAGSGPWRYLRYTLTPDGTVTLMDVGPKRAVDQAVAAFRRAGGTPLEQPASQTLQKLLLAQLPDGIRVARHWAIDPDGVIASLPFEALPDAGGLVLDGHSVRYLSSLAQLADVQAPAAAASRGALIIADPVYEPGAASRSALRLPTIMAQGGAWRDMQFQPLPETRVEAAEVSASLQRMGIGSRVLVGADATPEALRKADAPAFVHIASHGFLLSPAPELDPELKLRVRMAQPGLLAGLMLSAGQSGPVFLGTDLASLNLRGTRLVVLSACDTGNGSVDVHEGLSSLRRAVEEAGALASLTSLWPVPSLATVQVMKAFYAELAAGKSNAEALRQAKISIRNTGGAVRDWAGFVLAGAQR